MTADELTALRKENARLQAECLRVDEANSRLGEQVRQRDEVLHWLIGMDEPGSEARRTVTLTEIIRRAHAALEGDGR